MIRSAKDLSPEQKVAIESLLGRKLLESEDVSVRTIDPPALTDERRAEVLHGLEEHFAKVDSPASARFP